MKEKKFMFRIIATGVLKITSNYVVVIISLYEIDVPMPLDTLLCSS